MLFPSNIQSSITPAQAQKILAEHGLQVSLEVSEGILEFVVKLAQSTQQHEDSIPIREGKHRRAS